jgi:hypothetical protein
MIDFEVLLICCLVLYVYMCTYVCTHRSAVQVTYYQMNLGSWPQAINLSQDTVKY